MSVGLDIGSKTIKIVEIKEEAEKYVLKASGIVGHRGKVPEYVKDDKEMVTLSDAIKKLHKEAKIGSKDVSIALPEPQVYTRTIKLPMLTDAEIQSAVKWEAEQYIPIPVKEAIVQSQVIERREDVSPPYVTVLLVAAPKELVDKYAKLVDMAGLNLVGVETELLSIVRSLAPKDQVVLVVDFGARSTDMAVSKNGILTFSRSIPTAGDSFTRAIAQSLGIEENQAEEYKRTYGMSTSQLEGKIRGSLDPVFKMVAEEMKKAIRFYSSEEKGVTPQSAVLSGGTAGLPEIASSLTKVLGIEVIVGNPFSRIEVAPEAVKSLAGFAPFYSIAVGLAMREV